MRRQLEDSLRCKNIIKLTDEFYVDLKDKIGEGRFGVVYKGFNRKKDQIIAVKHLSTQVMNQFPKYERQIIVLEDVAKFVHPNIMGYYGYHHNSDGLFLFIEYCEGGTLTNLISQGISELKVVSLFEQIVSAMAFVNTQNKLHRDLKPDNILLSQRNNIKICDFGVAREIRRRMTKEVGTPLYNAPEMIKIAGEYNQKCDVWSVGLILYNMLTQEELFKNVQRINELIDQFKKFETNNFVLNLPQHLHPEWKKIISKMLTYNPAFRPTFAELQKQFTTVLDNMRKDLIQRYGYQNIEEEEEEELRLTRSHINPYEPYPQAQNNRLNDMVEKLKQQRSFNSLNKLRKWLNFTSSKFETLLSLIHQFNGPYNIMLNIYKFIIMFLTISGFIAKHLQLLKIIKDKNFTLPDDNFEEQRIVSTHKQYYQQMLFEFTKKFNSLIKANKSTLKTQIINSILGKYMERKQEKRILTSIGGLVDLVKNANNDVFEPYETYAEMYRKVISLQDVYFSMEQIKGSDKFQLKQVRVYTYIRLAAHLDTLLPNIQYKNEDYLKLRKQSLQNSSKEQLLQIIARINAK